MRRRGGNARQSREDKKKTAVETMQDWHGETGLVSPSAFSRLPAMPFVALAPSRTLFLSIYTNFYIKHLSRPSATAISRRIDCDKYPAVAATARGRKGCVARRCHAHSL